MVDLAGIVQAGASYAEGSEAALLALNEAVVYAKRWFLSSKCVGNRAAAFLECLEDEERFTSLVSLLSLETTG